MKRICTLLIFVLLVFLSCSKKDTNSSNQDFELTVLVLVDNIPTSDIDVTVGHVEFSRAAGGGTPTTTVKRTDSEGKVFFSFLPFDADVQYLCRVKNPFTLSWTDYRQANALKGQKKEEIFYIQSEN